MDKLQYRKGHLCSRSTDITMRSQRSVLPVASMISRHKKRNYYRTEENYTLST